MCALSINCKGHNKCELLKYCIANTLTKSPQFKVKRESESEAHS